MEVRLFKAGTIPEYTTPAWYMTRAAAPHLEQPGHRERLLETFRILQMAYRHGAQTVSDLGAGDGGLLSLIEGSKRRNSWGYDLQDSNVRAAGNRGVHVMWVDVINQPNMVAFGDVAVATEMLEHLVDPHLFVRRVFNSKAKWLLASSPYNETKHNHYEFHTWAWDCEGYAKMLTDEGWQIYEHNANTMCQIILARKP